MPSSWVLRILKLCPMLFWSVNSTADGIRKTHTELSNTVAAFCQLILTSASTQRGKHYVHIITFVLSERDYFESHKEGTCRDADLMLPLPESGLAHTPAGSSLNKSEDHFMPRPPEVHSKVQIFNLLTQNFQGGTPETCYVHQVPQVILKPTRLRIISLSES